MSKLALTGIARRRPMDSKKSSIRAENTLDTLSRSPSYKLALISETIGADSKSHNPRIMRHYLPSYLHALRKQSGFSQPDLAALLGISASALSRFEKQSRKPTAELIVAAEIIFGHRAKEIFPGFYESIDKQVIHRTRQQLKFLALKSEPDHGKQIQFLRNLIERTSQIRLDV